MKRTVLSPLALLEAAEARQWYEDRESGLGVKFVDALQEGLDRVQEKPEFF